MKLFVVVLCYRVVDLTIDCLRSLSEEICRVPGAKVGVLENGTGGDAAQGFRRAIEENGWGSWADLTVVYPTGDSPGATTLDPACADSDDPPEYVLLLNADTIVLEHALHTLVEFMDNHPRAGIAGSQFLSPDRCNPGVAVPLHGDPVRAGPRVEAWDRVETAVAVGRHRRPRRRRHARRSGSRGRA